MALTIERSFIVQRFYPAIKTIPYPDTALAVVNKKNIPIPFA